MIPRVLYHGWLSNRTSCNNDKVKNMETVSFDTLLKTVSKAFRLKWFRIGHLYFLGSEVLNYQSVHSGLSPTVPGFGVLEVSLCALMGIYELVAIFQKSKMEKHAQIKPDFQYLCFGALEFYQLRRAAQAVPGVGSSEMSLINKAWEWEWLLNKHSLLNRQKSFKYGIPGTRHNKECLNVKASLHRRLWKVKQAVGGSDATILM